MNRVEFGPLGRQPAAWLTGVCIDNDQGSVQKGCSLSSRWLHPLITSTLLDWFVPTSLSFLMSAFFIVFLPLNLNATNNNILLDTNQMMSPCRFPKISTDHHNATLDLFSCWWSCIGAGDFPFSADSSGTSCGLSSAAEAHLLTRLIGKSRLVELNSSSTSLSSWTSLAICLWFTVRLPNQIRSVQ